MYTLNVWNIGNQLSYAIWAVHRSIYSDGVEAQEAYNNYMRSMRRQHIAWQGKPTQPITRTILELVGNRKAPAENHACVQGMLLLSTKAMSDCFKSKGIGMPAGGAPVPRMMVGPANPSGMYDSKNKLAKFDDIKMKTCVANIIAATFKLKQQCGTLIASSRRLMQFGIRQAWRNTIGREPEPPWIVYIDFKDNDKSSVETRFKEVADKFSCILRREWYPRGYVRSSLYTQFSCHKCRMYTKYVYVYLLLLIFIDICV